MFAQVCTFIYFEGTKAMSLIVQDTCVLVILCSEYSIRKYSDRPAMQANNKVFKEVIGFDALPMDTQIIPKTLY